MNNNKIGLFIAELRKKKNLTQQELGNILYVTDKAVSKWERGLSLPDITILKQLAEVLDVDVIEILNGEKTKKKNIDIEKAIEEATKQIKINQQQKIKKMIIIITIITIFLIYIIFRNISLGYSIKTINYSHSITGSRKINLGVPKLSFMMKNRDYSYSYKNLRDATIVEKELKNYLKSLDYLTCNNTLYYYNKEDNYSIIEYSVKDNFLYSTISYAIVDNDYCYIEKIKEYEQKLGGIKRLHTLNASINSTNNNLDSILVILFKDGYSESDKIYEFKAELTIYNLEKVSNQNYKKTILEVSTGDIEIKDNKLYYYRTQINESEKNLKIPEVTIFEIYDERLYLTDNYLKKYYNDEIILK